MHTSLLSKPSWLTIAGAFVLLAILGTTAQAQSDACPIGGHPTLACPVTNDNIIRQMVAARIACPAVITCGSQVCVDVKDGLVTLTGVVDSQSRKELAGVVARSVRGVVCVSNQIVVSTFVSTDVELAGKVRQALSRAPFTTRGINVTVQDGIVNLTGIAATDYVREQAAMIAENVEGVSAVYNNVAVSGVGGSF